MILVNFGSSLTENEKKAVRCHVLARLDPRFVSFDRLRMEVIDVQFEWDEDAPFQRQIRKLVDAVGLDALRWRVAAVLVRLPGHTRADRLLLEEIDRRGGYSHWVVGEVQLVWAKDERGEQETDLPPRAGMV